METNQEEGKAENLFKNFGKKVDQFMVEINEAGERLHKEFDSRYDELKDAAERLKKEVKDKERWKEVENSLKKAGEEMNKAFKTAFNKEHKQ
jgi:citrate synthase